MSFILRWCMNIPKDSESPNQVEWSARGLGTPFLFICLEKPFQIAGLLLVLAYLLGSAWIVVAPILTAVVLLALMIFQSNIYESKDLDPAFAYLLEYKDKELEAEYAGKKIPIEIAVEAYMHEKLDFYQDDVMKVFKNRYDLFLFSFTLGHIKGFAKDIMAKLWVHNDAADKEDVKEVYNKGNDFYQWFMGDTMLYSSALFRDSEESLESSQERKLHTICKMIHMKPGDKHLDLGCGWGTLIAHAAKHYGTDSLGVTLSDEQQKFCMERLARYGVEDSVEIKLMNAWDLKPSKQFDKITCLEMSEHIGIRFYQKFMHHVRDLLKDDGMFYLQIAGLRRAWQYEDLIWGLFMGRYIFPGADASCPLYWVIEQVERAGFEVHRVENTGVHYSLTIQRWYENWVKNRSKVVNAAYGTFWWRCWAVFLAWSTVIAGQGSSTVYMITLTKNMKNDRFTTTLKADREQPILDRTEYWVNTKPGVKPIGNPGFAEKIKFIPCGGDIIPNGTTDGTEPIAVQC